MHFPPVIQRELAVAARRKSTAWGRTISASIAFGVFIVLMISHNNSRGTLGPDLLQIMSLFVLLESLFAGIRYTSDCLSEEKREGTLGLLFLTNLSALEVVLGKLVARSLGAVYNFLAILPVFSLCLLVGGVSAGQVLSTALILFVAIIFSLAVGLFVSSRGKNEKSVLIATLTLVAAICLLPPVLWKGLEKLLGYPEFLNLFLYLSPVYGYRNALSGWRPEVAATCWTLLGLSLFLIGCAAWKLQRSFSESEIQTLPAKEKTFPLRPGFARPFHNLLQENPMLWLVLGRRRSTRFTLFFGLGALAFGIFSRIVLDAQLNKWIPIVVFTSYGIHSAYKFLVAAESARQFNEDKRSGALELLLSTPLPPRWIVRGQLRATRKLWLFPAICLGLMNLTWMTNHEFLHDIPVFLPCSIFLLLPDSYALSWRAMLNALRGERYPATVFRTYIQVVGPPLAVLLLIFFSLANRSLNNETAQTILFLWTVACAIYDLFLIRASHRQLLHLRALAAGDKTPKKRIHWQPSPPPAVLPAMEHASST